MPDTAVQILVAVLTVVASVGAAYFTATKTVQHERASGQARLLEICRRYSLMFYNAIDLQAGTVRSDPLSYKMYVAELTFIISSLDELLSNVYVESLILRHPDVTKMLVLLRRELAEHQQEGKISRLNAGSISEVLKLSKVVRRDLKTRMYNKSFDTVLDELEAILRQVGLFKE